MAGANQWPAVGVPFERPSLSDALRTAAQGTQMSGNVDPPLMIISANGAAQEVLDTTGKRVGNLLITNCGTTVIKWTKDITPTADAFHGILAAAGAVDDGTGGYITLVGFQGKLFLFSDGGSKRVAIMVNYAP